MSFFRLFNNEVRSFRHLKFGDVPSSLFVQFSSQVYLTPRYQKIAYTQDFLKYLRFMQRKKTTPQSQIRSFVQNLLTQYHTLMLQDRPEVNIKMQKNGFIPPSGKCEYYGPVDWMYSINGFNMTPVMHFQSKLNPFCGIAMALSNMHMRSFLKDQFEKQYKSEHKIYNHTNSYSGKNVWGYSIITTGHQWQLIRIDKNLKLQKSVILQGNNKYRSIFHDEHMVTVLLGMLDYCLELPEINVRVLEKAYQYLDQSKYMIQGKDQEQIKKSSLISKLLLNYYRKKL